MIALEIIGIMILVVIITICVALVIPVQLAIDTDKELYMIYQPAVFSVCVLPSNEFRLQVKIAGIRLTLPAKTQKNGVAKKKKTQRNNRPKMRSLNAWKFLLRKVFGAVKIKSFQADIDTGDFPLNARLVPLLFFASRGPCMLNVNFQGRNYLGVSASVRPITILVAFFLFLTKQ